jgi:homoserine O-acetyltransferase
MSKTAIIMESLPTEQHSAQSANSQPKPNDGFVELHDFIFGDGGNLASLKLHYLTLGTPRHDASGAIVNAVLLRFRRKPQSGRFIPQDCISN